MKLSKTQTKMIENKLRQTAEIECSENTLWFAVIAQAIRDLSTAEGRASEAREFLEGRHGDINRVAELAGLNHEYIQRVIGTIETTELAA